ncbi:MAG TPA: NAD(+)/NADH kinase [Bacteroidales bacterium]|jgi:NAD+ kinase|nr:NAD(+)/NADH kinase [Bacteroidales bacterium]
MLNSVAIFSKDNTSKTRAGVGRLTDELNLRGVKIFMQKRSNDFHSSPDAPIEYFQDLEGLGTKPDFVFSVGGDGTFLETIIKVKDSGIPIAGINTGRMGFLANIYADEIGKSLDMLSHNEYDIIERCLLKLERPSNLFEGNNSLALNEITIQKSDLSMITISVYVNEAYLNTYWSDGLIISTATGSTAYNLSAGGPILTPEDESIIISPIAPHNLTIRPIVISGESKLKMIVEGRSLEYMATVDFRSRKVPFGEEVHIVRSHEKIKTVMMRSRDFYSTLRNKLMWGADSRN